MSCEVCDLSKKKIELALRCIEDDLYDFDTIRKLDLFLAGKGFFIYQYHNKFKDKLYYVNYRKSTMYGICITYDCYDELGYVDGNTELVDIESIKVERIPGMTCATEVLGEECKNK